MLIRLRLCEESKTILPIAHMIAPLIFIYCICTPMPMQDTVRQMRSTLQVIILTNRAKLSILNWRVNTRLPYSSSHRNTNLKDTKVKGCQQFL